MDQSPPLPCINCGYDLSSLATRICPECGYQRSPEDDANSARWEVYAAAIAWERWIVPAACPGLMLLGVIAFDLHFPVIFGSWLLLAALSLAGARWAVRSTPRRHRWVFLNAWWMATMHWLFIPLLALTAVTFASEFSDSFRWMFRWDHPRLFDVAIVATVYGVTSPMWYFSWRHHSRVAGVPEVLRSRAQFRRASVGALIALAPFTIIVLVGMFIGFAIWLADTLVPHWYMD